MKPFGYADEVIPELDCGGEAAILIAILIIDGVLGDGVVVTQDDLVMLDGRSEWVEVVGTVLLDGGDVDLTGSAFGFVAHGHGLLGDGDGGFFVHDFGAAVDNLLL